MPQSDSEYPFIKTDYGPSIFLSPGDVTYPARCPVCGSARYNGFKVYVLEDGTFALSPDPDRLKYQRYVRLSCAECLYTYHIRPEGLWYAKALPEMATILLTNVSSPANASDLRPTKESGQGFSREESLALSEIHPMPDQHSTSDADPRQQSPSLLSPKPAFNLLLKASWPVAVARRQDERIVDLARKKRYTDLVLNPRLTSAKIALLTGAGFSVPLGFPIMNGYFQHLPDRTQATLTQFSERHPRIRRAWLDDAEIATDLLLRLQRIAALSPTAESFDSHLHSIPHRVESIFVFREQYAGDWMSYPPLAHCVVSEELYPNTKTEHYQAVREMLYQVVSSLLLDCYRRTISHHRVREEYRSFFGALSRRNNGPVPLFTTNFDQAVEDLYRETGDAAKLVGGTGRKIWPRPRIAFLDSHNKVKARQIPYTCRSVEHQAYATVEREEVAVFHVHGCSHWFIDLTTGKTIAVDAPNREGLEHVFKATWESPTPWQPACIVPATVKDHYTISPPFNLGYDYFAQTLKHARVLVIIGQSLRDETLKELILWSARANDALRFVLVDKGAGVHQEAWVKKVLLDCIPESKLTLYSGRGFPDAAQDVLSVCSDLLNARAN